MVSVLGPRDRPRKWGPATARPDPRLPKRKTNPQDGQSNAPPGRQQSTTLGPGSQFRTTTDRLWTNPARRSRSIEPCHFAGSIAAGFNARTSNPRNALSEMRRARQRQRAVTWPTGRSIVTAARREQPGPMAPACERLRTQAVAASRTRSCTPTRAAGGHGDEPFPSI